MVKDILTGEIELESNNNDSVEEDNVVVAILGVEPSQAIEGPKAR